MFSPLDADAEFSWTEEEVADMVDNTHFIIAADGIMTCYSTVQQDNTVYTVHRSVTELLIIKHVTQHVCGTTSVALEVKMRLTGNMNTCCFYRHIQKGEVEGNPL